MDATAIIVAIISAVSAVSVAGFGVVIAKLNTIHKLANSNLAAANTRLDVALSKIEGLNTLVLAMQKSSHKPAPVEIVQSDPVKVAVVEP